MSIRGVVMMVLTAVVIGLSVAILRYHPAPPVDQPSSLQPPSTVAAVPILPPAPAPKPVAAPPPPAHPSKTKSP
jgi:hypothetical protein